jgi:hypothetical protein
MANDLDAFTPEYWSARTQAILQKILVSKQIANSEERANLSDGDKVHRPYFSVGNPSTYTRNTGFTADSDISTTDESLTIDTAEVLPVFVDKLDRIQNKYKAANRVIDQCVYKLKKNIDGYLFAEYDQATSDFDDGDMGGTATNPIEATVSNVLKILSKAKAKLRGSDVETNIEWFAALDPDTISIIEQVLPTLGFQEADTTLRKGYWGGFLRNFLGLDIYESTNLTFTAKWTPANNPTANDTVSINGVTFTFVASPASAGDVDIGTNTAGSLDNLVVAINAGAGAGTAYIELSAADRKKMYLITATDGTTYLTIECIGNSKVTVAASETADPWSLETTHCLVGQVGCIDQVIQDEVNVETVMNPIDPATGNRRLGKELIPNTLHGLKTFQEGKDRFLDLQIKNT